MTKLRSILAVLALAVALASPVLTVSPAQAYPSLCSSGLTTTNGGYAMCNGGSGQVRVVIGCQNLFGFWQNKYGKWVNVGGGASRAGCDWGYQVKWAGLGGLR